MAQVLCSCVAVAEQLSDTAAVAQVSLWAVGDPAELLGLESPSLDEAELMSTPPSSPASCE